MSNIKKNMSLFTKVYKRSSKSPFDDHGTILILASASVENDNVIILDYERYIYLHRESNGVICGISVSNKILAENPDFEGRYMYGVDMYAFLLLHIDEISEFCELFRSEFVELFLIPPSLFFSMAEEYWLQKLSDV